MKLLAKKQTAECNLLKDLITATFSYILYANIVTNLIRFKLTLKTFRMINALQKTSIILTPFS